MRLQTLLQEILDGAFAVDQTGRICEWNPAAGRLTGWKRDEVIGRRCSDVLSCRDFWDQSLCPQDCCLLQNAKKLPFVQVRVRDRSSRTLRLDCSTQPPPPQAGVQAIIRFRPSAGGIIEEAYPEPGSRGTPDGGIQPPDLARVLDRLLLATGADTAELFLTTPDRDGRLALVMHRGRAARAFRQISTFNYGQGFPGIVLKEGKPLVSLDLARDDRYLRTLVKSKGFRYYLCVPVAGQGDLIGSLHIASQRRSDSVTPHLPLLMDTARQLGLALAFYRLRLATTVARHSFDPALNAAANLQRASDFILDTLVHATEADGGVLVLMDETTGSARVVSSRATPPRLHRTLVHSCNPAACPFLNQPGCFLPHEVPAAEPPACVFALGAWTTAACLPLRLDRKLAGAAFLGYRRRKSPPVRNLVFLNDLLDRSAWLLFIAAAGVKEEQAAKVAARTRSAEEFEDVTTRALRPAVAKIDRILSMPRQASEKVSPALSPVLLELRAAIDQLSRQVAEALPVEPRFAAAAVVPAPDAPDLPPTPGNPDPGNTAPDHSGAPGGSVLPEPFLDFRCFGRFTIFREGIPLPPECFPRRRSLMLLKILLTRYGKLVHREELICLLWPVKLPPSAVRLLNVIVHYLRHSLEPELPPGRPSRFILTDAEGYRFNPESAHRLDTHEFLTAGRLAARLQELGDTSGALSACRTALSLYTGDFLEEEFYSDWCSDERVYLRERFLDILRQAARLHLGLGDVESAVDCYRRALLSDASLEDVHRSLMEVLWRAGRRDEALRQYRECTAALKRELGTRPLHETEALHTRILAGQPPDRA